MLQKEQEEEYEARQRRGFRRSESVEKAQVGEGGSSDASTVGAYRQTLSCGHGNCYAKHAFLATSTCAVTRVLAPLCCKYFASCHLNLFSQKPPSSGP